MAEELIVVRIVVCLQKVFAHFLVAWNSNRMISLVTQALDGRFSSAGLGQLNSGASVVVVSHCCSVVVVGVGTECWIRLEELTLLNSGVLPNILGMKFFNLCKIASMEFAIGALDAPEEALDLDFF